MVQNALPPDFGPPIPEKSKTIMLVEDEPFVRSAYRHILQQAGFFIIEATNGAEAVLLANQFSHPIDLLVTDLAMPKMNGYELVNQMAQIHPETEVLVLSGYSDGVLTGQPPPDKVVAFLAKPFRAQQLLEKISELLG
jgi:two-component system cell cycle sensor histidine kinase/response regulator CckA